MEDFTGRALAGEPLAYILEEWDFYGMTLYVNRDVLIPRDDTCAVTELALKKALFLEQDPRILDLCTGSGCIGLAIGQEGEGCQGHPGGCLPGGLGGGQEKRRCYEAHRPGQLHSGRCPAGPLGFPGDL